MAFRVAWLFQAKQDLKDIVEYYRLTSPRYSQNLAIKIKSATRTLLHFPLRGRIVPEFETTNIREIFVDSYRVTYSVDNNLVAIIAIIHMARDLNNLTVLQ
jgi:plasmid stabilization system protein ParE